MTPYEATWVEEITEEDLENKSTPRLLNILKKARRANSLKNNSWYCDGCPGPKDINHYCSEDEATHCHRVAGLNKRLKTILATREHIE